VKQRGLPQAGHTCLDDGPAYFCREYILSASGVKPDWTPDRDAAAGGITAVSCPLSTMLNGMDSVDTVDSKEWVMFFHGFRG
jgi:hypothetical protein